MFQQRRRKIQAQNKNKNNVNQWNGSNGSNGNGMMNRSSSNITSTKRWNYNKILICLFKIVCCGCFLVILSAYAYYSYTAGIIEQKYNLAGSALRTVEGRQHNDRCWLKHRFQSGEFKLVSHRSFVDSSQPNQPSCEDSLHELKNMGIKQLDLDLVLDQQASNNNRLIVAHPMEYTKEASNYYSPCSNIKFDDMIQLLQKVYDEDFYVSLEPKAAWHNTPEEIENKALVNLPSTILEELLDTLQRNPILNRKCGIIIDMRQIRGMSNHEENELTKQQTLINSILKEGDCHLLKGIGIQEPPPKSMDTYDFFMPSIEFHPDHNHNPVRPIDHGQWTIPPKFNHKSLYWVVDNYEDLQLAAELRPKGIVSNKPKHIIEIINSPDWC